MITRYDGYGSFAKQFLKEGSIGSTMKVSPLHSHGHHTYCSGENLSPRSVLEQRAISGLAIALDLEEKMKLPHAQENVILGRFLSKQSIMQMNTQEDTSSVGRSVSRERLHHTTHGEREADDDDRETVSREANVGLKMHQMRNTQEAHKDVTTSRSGSRERINVEKRGISNVVTSRGGEREEDNVATAAMGAGSSGDMVVNAVKTRPLPDSPRNAPAGQQSTFWPDVQQRFCPCHSAVQDSIFYCAPDRPSAASYHCANDEDDDGYPTPSPVEDFLKRCFLCKCHLRAGKDIYMYRGDQAFCSVECRYEQIVKDEYIGASAA